MDLNKIILLESKMWKSEYFKILYYQQNALLKNKYEVSEISFAITFWTNIEAFRNFQIIKSYSCKSVHFKVKLQNENTCDNAFMIRYTEMLLKARTSVILS
jgi:hypothetical protein